MWVFPLLPIHSFLLKQWIKPAKFLNSRNAWKSFTLSLSFLITSFWCTFCDKLKSSFWDLKNLFGFIPCRISRKDYLNFLNWHCFGESWRDETKLMDPTLTFPNHFGRFTDETIVQQSFFNRLDMFSMLCGCTLPSTPASKHI